MSRNYFGIHGVKSVEVGEVRPIAGPTHTTYVTKIIVTDWDGATFDIELYAGRRDELEIREPQVRGRPWAAQSA